MKSILFLIPSLQPRGAERVLVNLANGLDKQRYEVTVQTLFDVGELRSLLDKEVIYRPGLPWLIRGNVHLLKLFSPRLAYGMIVRRRYDVVVAFLEGAVTRIMAGCPYADSTKVAWIHGEQQSLKNAAYCYRNVRELRECYDQFNLVACVSETVQMELRRFLPSCRCEDIRVLPNVNDDREIRRLGALPLPAGVMEEEGLHLVSCGALTHVKGFDRLIYAHRCLLDWGIKNHLYILGSGAEQSKLWRQIQELKVEETVHLLGHQQNPYHYIAHADLYVCASRQEGCSTAVTEALILGTPVISTKCSGSKDLLGDKEQFGIVTENNRESLAEGLRRMLGTPDTLVHYRTQAEFRGSQFSRINALTAIESALFVN